MVYSNIEVLCTMRAYNKFQSGNSFIHISYRPYSKLDLTKLQPLSSISMNVRPRAIGLYSTWPSRIFFSFLTSAVLPLSMSTYTVQVIYSVVASVLPSKWPKYILIGGHVSCITPVLPDWLSENHTTPVLPDWTPENHTTCVIIFMWYYF